MAIIIITLKALMVVFMVIPIQTAGYAESKLYSPQVILIVTVISWMAAKTRSSLKG